MLVQRLAESAANVVSVFGRTQIADLRADATQTRVDVTDSSALTQAIDAAVHRSGKLGCVVFLQRHRGPKDAFRDDVEVSVGASVTAIDHIVSHALFDSDDAGRSFVFVGSIADTYVAPEQSLGYHVAKAGLAQLARYYAMQLGSSGVRVNVVSPCIVAKDTATGFYADNPWIVDRFRKLIPLGRMGTSDDIVRAILFLGGSDAAYITGQNLVVDGGLTLRSHESLIRDVPGPAS